MIYQNTKFTCQRSIRYTGCDQALLNQRRYTPPTATHEFGDVFKKIAEQMTALNSFTEVEPFADDIGEYIWLSSATRDGVPATEKDAYRALDFIFWWIIRWETFCETIVTDRRSQWLISQRHVRSDPAQDSRSSGEGQGRDRRGHPAGSSARVV